MEALTLERLDYLEALLAHPIRPLVLDDDLRALLAMARSSLADREDAKRYRWLRDRLHGADFMYGEPAICAVIFEWPKRAAISADLDASIDAAQPPKD